MPDKLTILMGRIFCRLGMHDFKVINTNVSFGSAGTSTVQCKRCGQTYTRQN